MYNDINSILNLIKDLEISLEWDVLAQKIAKTNALVKRVNEQFHSQIQPLGTVPLVESAPFDKQRFHAVFAEFRSYVYQRSGASEGITEAEIDKMEECMNRCARICTLLGESIT